MLRVPTMQVGPIRGFVLEKAGEAYRTMDEGKSGKVAIVFDE